MNGACLGMPTEKVGKNITHPEMKEDEIFLTNVNKPGGVYLPGSRAFNNVNYKTKRLGKIAYDENGNEIKGMLPVFIKKWEVK